MVGLSIGRGGEEMEIAPVAYGVANEVLDALLEGRTISSLAIVADRLMRRLFADDYDWLDDRFASVQDANEGGSNV